MTTPSTNKTPMNNYSQFLSDKKNWTPIRVYIHRTRLIFGFILGTLFGVSITLSFFI